MKAREGGHSGASDEEQGLLQDYKTTPPATPSKGPRLFGVPVVVVAGLSYCLASGSMVLLNKAALSGFNFRAPLSLLLFQCALAVVMVKICEAMGYDLMPQSRLRICIGSQHG